MLGKSRICLENHISALLGNRFKILHKITFVIKWDKQCVLLCVLDPAVLNNVVLNPVVLLPPSTVLAEEDLISLYELRVAYLYVIVLYFGALVACEQVLLGGDRARARSSPFARHRVPRPETGECTHRLPLIVARV